jgi:hypothetical protein
VSKRGKKFRGEEALSGDDGATTDSNTSSKKTSKRSSMVRVTAPTNMKRRNLSIHNDHVNKQIPESSNLESLPVIPKS